MGGTARSTGWLWDLVGAVLPFNAVCKAVAKADVSDVTVNREVPEDIDVGSLVGGLLQMEIREEINRFDWARSAAAGVRYE